MLGKTGAKPEIWKQKADFNAKLRDFQDAAKALQAAAAKGDGNAIKAGYANLGKTCQACHDSYRTDMHHLGMHKVRIWDVPTRLFHWALVGLIGFSWWSAEEHHLDWHIWSGIGVLTLLVFRIFWGLFGSSTARFANFDPWPARGRQLPARHEGLATRRPHAARRVERHCHAWRAPRPGGVGRFPPTRTDSTRVPSPACSASTCRTRLPNSTRIGSTSSLSWSACISRHFFFTAWS